MVVATFYKFTPIPSPADLRERALAFGAGLDLRGSLLVAPEGINGYVSGEPEAARAFVRFLAEQAEIGELEHKETPSEGHAFGRFKVRLKREIVTIGIPTDPRGRVGRYVEADEWNRLLDDPETTVIDVRNRYEIREGTFPGAIDPGTDAFREFPEFVAQNLDPKRTRRVATFCTGGIRCEKATSYLLSLGFEDVIHLRGGILRYLQTAGEDENRWQGRCYVFDERGSV